MHSLYAMHFTMHIGQMLAWLLDLLCANLDIVHGKYRLQQFSARPCKSGVCRYAPEDVKQPPSKRQKRHSKRHVA